ncbi:wax ester/triacylglycerol synthase family O-acyltransferase [Amycolatopsis tucumanensis]|uniref:Diacylglycerol O-acyltransferase n=1 Tax=Amycolatopsis tucumanensis TaxID=401106 RepID=A0ABP7HNI1_9PSEU|nr:wax ester/triacylglycerol synthase family O-acyltransferase [Amycolatopsis tucumanensis]MCF6420642.1 wax ester/triacylglycerol synthase family O-acyltransferase [Amycolatopsis tucumanensis]
MDRLSPLDALFLAIEDEDPSASLAIASIAVLEAPAPPQDEIVRDLTPRVWSLPRYRQRLRRYPLDLAAPAWVEEDGFDPATHFHRVAAPSPGDDAALREVVGLVMSERLPRDRPLWECWVIEGLAEGRWAVLSKVHHCLTDGIGGNALHEAMFGDEPPPRPEAWPAAETAPEPGGLRLLAGGLRTALSVPVEQMRVLAGAARSPRRMAAQVTGAVRGLASLARALVPLKASSLRGKIHADRRYAMTGTSLGEVARIATGFGVTVNDVVLATITAGLRQLLLERGEEPAATSVRSLVPVSVRSRSDQSTLDNHVSLMLPMLPVDVADPVERLRTVHERLAVHKASREREAGQAVLSFAGHEPYPPVSWAMHAAPWLVERMLVTVTTNVPGPREQLHLLGRPVVALYPYVPIALRLRIGVAVLSYHDRLAFGVTADFDSVPDVDVVVRAIEKDLDQLGKAVPGKEGSRAAHRRRR